MLAGVTRLPILRPRVWDEELTVFVVSYRPPPKGVPSGALLKWPAVGRASCCQDVPTIAYITPFVNPERRIVGIGILDKHSAIIDFYLAVTYLGRVCMVFIAKLYPYIARNVFRKCFTAGYYVKYY